MTRMLEKLAKLTVDGKLNDGKHNGTLMHGR